MWDLGVSESAALYVASCLDIDGSGVVNFQEFAAACCSLSEEQARKLLCWVFDAFDKAGEKGLSLDEIHALVEQAPVESIHRADIAEWLREARENLQGLEGRISHRTFKQQCGRAIDDTEVV